MAVTLILDADGNPFSKWKPAVKYRYMFEHSEWSDMMDHCEEEFGFDEDRKWRFDFAWPTVFLAVEIDGFGWGHQAQQNVSASNEKQNAAVAKGWKVLRFDSRMLGSLRGVEDAVELTAQVLCEWD